MDIELLHESDFESIETDYGSDIELLTDVDDYDIESINSNSSDDEWAAEHISEPLNFLDEDILLQIKRKDPRITSLHVSFGNRGDGVAADIDWQNEEKSFAENAYIEKVKIHEHGGGYVDRVTFDGFCRALARSRSINCLQIDEANNMGMCSLLSPLFVQLTVLSLDDCHVTNIACTHLLASSLSTCRSLEQLSLRDNYISDNSAEIILGVLNNACTIVKLSLENNHVEVKGCIALSKLLHNPKCKLEVLNLLGNDIGDNGGGILTKAMANNGTVKNVLIGGCYCQINESGWQAMFGNLHNSKSSKLEELGLNFNRIDHKGVLALTDVLADTDSITSLDISFSLHISDTASWRALFQHTSRLTRLSLNNTFIDDEGIDLLANSLATKHNRMKVLDLSSCPGVRRWQSFLHVVGNANCLLEELILSRNSIEDDSMIVFGDALARNSSLKVLFIDNMMHTTTEGWKSLFGSLKISNCVIEKLNLLGNALNDDVLSILATMLTNNTKLTNLYINCSKGTTGTGWAAISTALCGTSSIPGIYNSNHTLEELSENDAYEPFIPRRLKSLLGMNTNKNKSEVARCKILRYRLLAADGPIDIGEFVHMGLKMLPHALAWMGRDKRGRSVLFSLLCSLPSILGSDKKVNAIGVKRKREV